MSDEHTGGSHRDDDVFIADPSGFDDELLAERPGWPKPVGIVGLILSVFWLGCGGLGFVFTGVFRKMMASMEGGAPDVVLNPPQLVTAVQVGSTLWTVVMAVASVALLARKPFSRILFLVYAIIGIPLTLWGASQQFDIMLATAEWVKANPDAEFSRQQQMGGSMGGIVTLVVIIGVSMAWQVFLLVWFGLVKRKPTDITGTAPEAAA